MKLPSFDVSDFDSITNYTLLNTYFYSLILSAVLILSQTYGTGAKHYSYNPYKWR